MKDEYAGRTIRSFVGLQPKMYSIADDDGGENHKDKGISKRVTAQMKHEHFYKALMEEQTTEVSISRIASIHHELYAINVQKKGLSPFDDKRYVLHHKITTLAHGHYRIANENV